MSSKDDESAVRGMYYPSTNFDYRNLHVFYIYFVILLKIPNQTHNDLPFFVLLNFTLIKNGNIFKVMSISVIFQIINDVFVTNHCTIKPRKHIYQKF